MSLMSKISTPDSEVIPQTYKKAGYTRKPGCYEVEKGVFYGRNVWLLKEHLLNPNKARAASEINFDKMFSEDSRLSRQEREHLTIVAKDFCLWEGTKGDVNWDSVISRTQWLLKAVFDHLSSLDYVRLADLRESDLVSFTSGPNLSDDGKIRRRLLASNLSALYADGTLHDGISFKVTVAHRNPAAAPSGKPRVQTKARPFSDDVLIPALASADTYMRTYKTSIIEELRDIVGGKTPDLERFPLLRDCWTVHHFGFPAVIRHYQRAGYIKIAETIVSRINEVSDLRVGCCTNETIDGEEAIVVAMAASKQREKDRNFGISLGIDLTQEAIEDLEAVVAAYPPVQAKAGFLFPTFFQHSVLSRGVGECVGPDMLADGIIIFLREIGGFSETTLATVKSHRFRSTTMMKLCQQPNGVVAAKRQARVKDINTIMAYTQPEASSPIINQHIDHLVMDF